LRIFVRFLSWGITDWPATIITLANFFGGFLGSSLPRNAEYKFSGEDIWNAVDLWP
jgi:hypothetical protein